jgi:hypothetical protein
VAITIDIPPGGDWSTDNEIILTEQYTVDAVPALRHEIAGADGGFSPDPSVLWIIGIAGNLPAVGNDQPYLAIAAYSSDPNDLAEWIEVLDRMVATLDIGE